jgi:hypothetical protein
MGEEGGNCPLGEREAVERRKSSVVVKIEDRSVLTDPPRYIWMVLPSGVSGHMSGVSGYMSGISGSP